MKMERAKHNSLWLYYFLLAAICIPSNEKYPTLLKYALNGLLVISVFVSILLLYNKRYFLRKLLVPLYSFFAWILMCSVFNSTGVLSTLKYIAPLICASSISIYVLEEHREKAYDVIAWIFAVLLIIQAFSLFTHFFGIYYSQGQIVNYYFFGIRVNINKIFPFAVYFAFMSYKYGVNRKPYCLIITLVCGLYFSIVEKVSTSIVGFAIGIMVFLATALIHNKHFWRYMAIIFLVVCVAFVFAYSERKGMLDWLFTGLLGESSTMSGRTLIWEQALSNIHGVHWLIGNGYGHDIYFYLGQHWAAHATHNQYLGIIFNYGIVGLLIYAKMCIIQIRTNKANMAENYSRIFMATFLAILFMQIPASLYERTYYYIFYVVSVYSPTLIRANNENKTKNNNKQVLTITQSKMKGLRNI